MFAVAIHGGAGAGGAGASGSESALRSGLARAVQVAEQVLRANGRALDAV